MGKKYFSWNFDDGLEQDKKIVEVLKQYGIGATFNLNSGMYGQRHMIGRIGILGLRDVPMEKYKSKKYSILKYVPHCRIPEDEIAQVYEGFEIASHTVNHINMTKANDLDVKKEVLDDRKALSEKFSQEIVGFAYPFGAKNGRVKRILKECGIMYARTVASAKNFSFPKDPLELPVTGWHTMKNALPLLDQFVQAEETEEDQFFLMFAHGYEFDFGLPESSWEKFCRICDKVASRADIICCSTGEALSRRMKG